MKEPTPLQIGIREQRKLLNITQAQLAERIGVGQDFIALFESGKRGMDLERIAWLADALQLDRAELVKLALFEAAPTAYKSIFGERTPEWRRSRRARTAPDPAHVYQRLMQVSGDLKRASRTLNAVCLLIDDIQGGG